ncbi:MAG: OmpH family outer membrane protein [Bacteroidota bacterium]|nr:OmpH family outer membrane protein [Bacteroidota bacterium]
MKSTNKISIGIAGILVTACFCLFAGMTVQAQKFAYVDTEYILSKIPDYKIAQTQIDDISSKWQKDIEGRFAEIDKMYKTYEADATMLPEEMKRKRENEIINKEKEVKDLQKQRFGQNGDLFKKRQELIKPIQDKVYNAIEAVSTQDNIAIVFDKASGATMIYTNNKFDISDEVLKKLGITNGNQQTNPPANQQNKPVTR